MYRRFMQALLVLLLALGPFGAVAPQAALAASGGGCSNNDAKISSCISYNRGAVVGDYYMNAYPDRSVYYACLEVYTSTFGTIRAKTCDTLNHNGRFGPLAQSVVTLPPSHGWAITRVRVYTKDWTPHYVRESPRLYY